MKRTRVYSNSGAHAMGHLTRIQYRMAKAGLQREHTSNMRVCPCKHDRTVPHGRRNQGGHCMEDCRNYGLHQPRTHAQALGGKRLLHHHTHLGATSRLLARDSKCKRHGSDQSSSSRALRGRSQIERAALNRTRNNEVSVALMRHAVPF